MEDKVVLLKDDDYLTFWKDNLTKDDFYRTVQITTVANTTSPTALVLPMLAFARSGQALLLSGEEINEAQLIYEFQILIEA
ncbi:hypothetical protein [Draconibacterium orientale]|uniref:hypothetical protein n=1 Tax=Draconibacterium orientale TaxID=1168034 RepID=UPI002ABD9643|nr:hypothetical protein [Draconibacterium orientale]